MLTVLLIFLALVVLYFLLTWVLFRLIVQRFRPGHDPLKPITRGADRFLDNYPDYIAAGKAWLNTHTPKPVQITSFDGLKLCADLYETPGAKAVLVAAHGYRSNGAHDFLCGLPFYASQGFSILLIHQRACGRSEGRYITFGVRERLDMQDWCGFAAERWPDMPVVIGGVSMGASSALMACDALPGCVKGVLADCGYCSPWDEMVYVIRHFAHIPAGPLMRGIDFWCRLLAGFSLQQLDTETTLQAFDRPVLLIHGEADDLVPPENSVKNRDARPDGTVLLTVPGANHGLSFLVDNDGYTRAAADFFRKLF